MRGRAGRPAGRVRRIVEGAHGKLRLVAKRRLVCARMAEAVFGGNVAAAVVCVRGHFPGFLAVGVRGFAFSLVPRTPAGSVGSARRLAAGNIIGTS